MAQRQLRLWLCHHIHLAQLHRLYSSTCKKRLSPMSSGARLMPRCRMQSWQELTMMRAAAAISCTPSHRSIRT